MSLRGTKQSPIVGGDCFGKNALATTFAKKAERTYLEDYTDNPVFFHRYLPYLPTAYSCPEKFFPKTCQVWRRKNLSGYLYMMEKIL
jgi:hypothetical protein